MGAFQLAGPWGKEPVGELSIGLLLAGQTLRGSRWLDRLGWRTCAAGPTRGLQPHRLGRCVLVLTMPTLGVLWRGAVPGHLARPFCLLLNLSQMLSDGH